MRPRSLVFRLSLLQQITAVALILAFAALAIWITAGTLARQETLYVSDAARHVAVNLEREWLEEGDLARAATAVIEESAPPDAWVDVFDARGRLVAATAAGARRPARGELHQVRLRLSRGATVVVSVSTRLRNEAVSALYWALLLTALPLLVAGAVVSRVLARRTLSPLTRLTAEADRAAAQATPRELTVPSDPAEIVTLSTAFDRLLAQVHLMLRAERNFSQDAAHELRTPLTVLSGELEMALSDPALPPRHRHGLEHAAEQTRAMSELVEALLLLRRADAASSEAPVDFVRVDLRDLVRDVVAELRDRGLLRAADLEVAAADEALVPGNATLLAAALRNLLTNAFKFTDPGQPVRVSVSAGPDRGTLVVEDGGPGISPADRERIFDPFFRSAEARAVRGGVGLGLPIILRVARAHGGGISVSDSPLGGARFELRLPARPPTA
jgi:signal transduction histidine kinase